MSMITLRFTEYLCNDCGHKSPAADLLSFSIFAPPPDNYSYDGECLKCGSKNTVEQDLFSEID